MKHTYLLLEDGKLRVYQSETEMPQPPELPKYRDKERDEFLGAEYLAELKSWKQQAKSTPVHETCEEKLKYHKSIFNIDAYNTINVNKLYDEKLNFGIKLPEGLVRFYIIPELDKNDIFSSTTPLKEYAFLVEKPVEKEEDLWPSDEEINNIFSIKDIHTGLGQQEQLRRRRGAKQLRDYLKQHYSLIKKK